MTHNILEIAERIKAKGIIPIPASDSEIKNIQKLSANNKLPKSYIDFLKTMGNGTKNGFLRGHSCFINEIPKLKEWANELLQDNVPSPNIPKSAFVFWMSQGYQFAFFNTDESNDPPIYYYREGTNQDRFAKITNSFSEFLSKIENNDKDIFNI